jgi:signal recognition particle receptor subunit beta
VFVNWKLRELNLKVVYYGPSLAGKTTNLQYVHARTRPQMRSELVSLKTYEDRTIFFDFMQLELSEVKGLKPRFSLYTVPGQIQYAASRKLVLQGADGVVFVADSRLDRLADNLWNLAGLEKYLGKAGRSLGHFPLVLQCNKQDLRLAVHPEALKVRLGLNGVQCFGAVAAQGEGVFDTLKAILHQVVQEVQSSG